MSAVGTGGRLSEPPEGALFDAALPRCLGELQLELQKEGLHGWLLYDHRGLSPLVARVLGFDEPPRGRYFYWVPALDMPALVVHEADAMGLPTLPGDVLTYTTYAELRQRLEQIVPTRGAIAMEHSPVASVPDLSRVDAGTLELVRAGGSLQIRSSIELVNRFFGPLGEGERALAVEAYRRLSGVRDVVVRALARPGVTEADVRSEAASELSRANLLGPTPYVAFGPNTQRRSHVGQRRLEAGELVSIDLYARLPHGPFAHVGVTAGGPQHAVRFERVRSALDRAIEVLRERLRSGARVLGYEVDRGMKDALGRHGRVLTRGGHHLGFVPWSSEAATPDDTEIHDTRELHDGTAWSLHPTVWDGEIAVRARASVQRRGSTLEILDAGQSGLQVLGA